MKTLKKIFIIIAIIIIIIIFGGYLLINRISKSSIPDYNEEITLKCVSDEVTIYRDSLAIPHIIAKNERDLYIATGYLLAQDRLWQMDLLRRVTQGRLSEIFGDDMVEVDLMMRALQITEKSKIVLDSCDENIKQALKSFSCGINEYITEHKKNLPFEFKILGYEPELWQPINSVNLIGYLAWDLTCGLDEELILYKAKSKVDSALFQMLIPKTNSQKYSTFPDFKISDKTIDACLYSINVYKKIDNLGVKVFNASNNWAVAGKKTYSGKPLLANDMHLGIFIPGIWYQIHQIVEGKINVTGVLLPGAPFVISGHNDSIAWGMTNVMEDNVDLYLETINNDTTKYLLNGQWHDLKIQNEQIKSKSGKIFNKKLYFTHRGPIISMLKKIDTAFISMRWVGNDYSNEVRSAYLINKANNWNDFKCAMKTFSATSQNVIYADVNGNIGLYCCAGIPLRKAGGIAILPGNTDQYDWQGYVPFEKLPHSYNPPCGYLLSANSLTAPMDYPYYISTWYYPPVRYNRIKELIENTEKHNVESFKKIQTDFKSLLPDYFLPSILNVLNNNLDKLDETEKQSFELLNKWNKIYSADRPEPLIFEKLFLKLFENTVKDELGDEITTAILNDRSFTMNIMLNMFADTSSKWFDNITTANNSEHFSDQTINAFKSIIAELKEKEGNDVLKWMWGKYHLMTLSHPLGKVKILDMLFRMSRGPFPLPGSYSTVCPYSYSLNKPFEVNNGASQRHIYDLSNWDNSVSVIPTGISGIPSSKYYCNQTLLYLTQNYHSDIFNNNDIKNKAKYIMKLKPKIK